MLLRVGFAAAVLATSAALPLAGAALAQEDSGEWVPAQPHYSEAAGRFIPEGWCRRQYTDHYAPCPGASSSDESSTSESGTDEGAPPAGGMETGAGGTANRSDDLIGIASIAGGAALTAAGGAVLFSRRSVNPH